MRSKRKMNFYTEKQNMTYSGKYNVFTDKSFTFLPNYYAPYVLVLNKFYIEINCFIDKNNLGHLVLLGGVLKNPEKCKINIPQFERGVVKFTDFDFESSGSNIVLEGGNYYDEKTGWICVGKLLDNIQAIEFATNTLAVIKEQKLIALYAKVI